MSGHTYTHTHIHTIILAVQCAQRVNYYKFFESLKLIHIIYNVLMQNRSCFTRNQTCNGEYTKHGTRSN